MKPPPLERREVHVWVVEAAQATGRSSHPDRAWGDAAMRDHFERLYAHAAAKAGDRRRRSGLRLVLAQSRDLAVVCAAHDQDLGLSLATVSAAPDAVDGFELTLSDRARRLIAGECPRHRARDLSSLRSQRYALADALGLEGVSVLARVNPLFVDGDFRFLQSVRRHREVGGRLLLALGLDERHVCTLCCSPLTERLLTVESRSGYDEIRENADLTD